jgi:tRNA splicing endonuclease
VTLQIGWRALLLNPWHGIFDDSFHVEVCVIGLDEHVTVPALFVVRNGRYVAEVRCFLLIGFVRMSKSYEA